jgi:uncharacterized RDD family membrane protein YckC
MEIKTAIAPYGKRFLAYLIDIIIIVIIVVSVNYWFLGFDKIWSNYLNRGEDTLPREVFLKQRNVLREIAFLVWMMYCTIMEASKKQGTIGKQIMGIKVVNMLGNPLSLQQSIARNFAKIISYKVLCLGFIWILVDKMRQGWHDKMTKTYVVTNDLILEIDEEDPSV